jgi:hypothetical protein
MNEVLHANIFFIIASIGVVIFIILTCVILFHIIKLLRSVRSIIERVEAGSEVIAEDVSQLRAYVTQGSFVSHIMSFVFGKSARSASRSKRKETDESNT